MRRAILLLLFLYPAICFSQTYSGISFYVVAHQEDWQCFMGRDAWNDMHMSGKKVVLINITAGNWTTAYLPGCCRADCDSLSTDETAYYFATESAEKRSIDLAAGAMRARCPGVNSPYNVTTGRSGIGKTEYRTFRGTHLHDIAVYTNNNIVCYFLRLDEGALTNFYKSEGNIFAVDGSTRYSNFDDLGKTIAGIYKYELQHDLADTFGNPYIHTFDDDLSDNPMDHIMHYYAKTVAYAACALYDPCPKINWHFKLYEGLYLKNELPNLKSIDEAPEIQNKAALYAAWCIGMLSANAQVDWGYFPTAGYSGTDFQDKEYYTEHAEEMGQCDENKEKGNSEAILGAYPNPVSNQLTIELGDKNRDSVLIRLMDANGVTVYTRSLTSEALSATINTSAFAGGPYIVLGSVRGPVIYKSLIIVHH
jgi:hypothetical protein